MSYTTYFTSRYHQFEPFNYALEGPFQDQSGGLDSGAFYNLSIYYPALASQWSPFMQDYFIAPPNNFSINSITRQSTLPSAFINGNNVIHSSQDFASWGTILITGSGYQKVRIAAADRLNLSIYKSNTYANYGYYSTSDYSFLTTLSTQSNYTTANKDDNNSYNGNSIEFEFYAHCGEKLWLVTSSTNFGSSNLFSENPHAFAYTFSHPTYLLPNKEDIIVSFNTDNVINDYDSTQLVTIPVTCNISTSNKYLNQISITRYMRTPNDKSFGTSTIVYSNQVWGRKSNLTSRNLSVVDNVPVGIITPSQNTFSVTFNDSIQRYVYDEEYIEVYYQISLNNEQYFATYTYDTIRKRIYELPRIYKFDYKFLNGNYIFDWYVVNGTVKSLIGKSTTNSNNQTIYFDNNSLSNSSTYTIPSSSIIDPGSYKLVVSNAYGTKSTISASEISLKYNPDDITVSEVADIPDNLTINSAPTYLSGQKTEKAIITLPGKTTITVPQNCVKATVKMWGAGGKDGNIPPGFAMQNWFALGGSGGFGKCNIIVCPGDTIDVYVGKSGEGTSENKITGQFTSNRGGGWSGIVYGQQHLIVGGGGAGGDYFYDPINNTYYGGGNGGDGVGAFSSGNPGTEAFRKFNSISTTSGTSTSNSLLTGKGAIGYVTVQRPNSATTNSSNLPINYFLYSYPYTNFTYISNDKQEDLNEAGTDNSSSQYYSATIPDFSLPGQLINDNPTNVFWINLKYTSVDSYAAVGRFYRRVENGFEILDLNNGGCSVSETVEWRGTVNQTIVSKLDPNLGGGGGGGYYGGFGAIMGGGGGGGGNLYNYITFYSGTFTIFNSSLSNIWYAIPQISGVDVFLNLSSTTTTTSVNGVVTSVVKSTTVSETSLSDYNLEASTGTYALQSNSILDNTANGAQNARYNRYLSGETRVNYDPNGPSLSQNTIWGAGLGSYDVDYVAGTGGRNQDGAVVITFYTFTQNEEKYVFTEDATFDIPARRRFRMLVAGGAGGAGSADPATVNYKSYKTPNYSINDDSSLGIGGLGGFGNAIWSTYKNSKQQPKRLTIQIGKCGQDGKDATNGIALGGISSFSSGGNGGKVEQGSIVGGVGGGGGGASAVYEQQSSSLFKAIKSYSIISNGYYVKSFNPIIDQYTSAAPQENKFRNILAYAGSGVGAAFDLTLKSRETLRYAFGYSRADYETIIQDVDYDYNDYTIDILEDRTSGIDYIAVGLPKLNQVRIYSNTIASANLLFTITPPSTDFDVEYFGRSISFSGEHFVSRSRSLPFIAIGSLSTDNRPKIYIYQFSTGVVPETRIYTGVSNATYVFGRAYSFSWRPYFTLHSVISPPAGTWDQQKDGYFGYAIKFAYFKDPVAPFGTASTNIRNQRLLYVGCPGYNNNTGIVYVYKIAGEITSPIAIGTVPYYNHTNFAGSPSGYSISFDNSLSSSEFSVSTSYMTCSNCSNCSIFTENDITARNNQFTTNIGNILGASQNSYFGYSIANGDRQNSISGSYGEGRYVYISAPGENASSGKVYAYDISFEYGVSQQNSITTSLILNQADDNLHNGDSYPNWNNTTKTASIGNAYSRYTLQHFKIFDNPNPSDKDYFGSKILAFKNSANLYITASGEDINPSDNNGKTYRYNSSAEISPSKIINGAGRLMLIEEFNVSSIELTDGGTNYETNNELYFDLEPFGFTYIADTLINPLSSATISSLETPITFPNYCRIQVTNVVTDLSPRPVCISAGGGGGGGGVKDLPIGIDSYHSGQSRSIVYPYISSNYNKALSVNGVNASTSISNYVSQAVSKNIVGHKEYSITGKFYSDPNSSITGPGGYASSGGGGGGGGCPPGGSKLISPRISTVSSDTLSEISAAFDEYKFNNDIVPYSSYYTIYDERSNVTSNLSLASVNVFTTMREMTKSYLKQYFDTTDSLKLAPPSKNGWVQDPLVNYPNTPGIAGGPGFSVIGTGILNNELVTSGITTTSEKYLPTFIAGFSNFELGLTNSYQPYKVPKNGFVYIELLPQFNILHRLSNGNWVITTNIYVFYNGWRKVRDAFIYKNNAWKKLN